jgi:dihydroxyacetone kinase-like protein
MIDSLQAITQALSKAQPHDDLVALARNAASKAIEEFRDKPNRIGRARMFAEKSIGMDDPGMVAVLRMTESL